MKSSKKRLSFKVLAKLHELGPEHNLKQRLELTLLNHGLLVVKNGEKFAFKDLCKLRKKIHDMTFETSFFSKIKQTVIKAFEKILPYPENTED